MSAVVATKIGPWDEVLELQDAKELLNANTKPEDGTLLVRVVTCGLAFPDILVVEVCAQPRTFSRLLVTLIYSAVLYFADRAST